MGARWHPAAPGQSSSSSSSSSSPAHVPLPAASGPPGWHVGIGAQLQKIAGGLWEREGRSLHVHIWHSKYDGRRLARARHVAKASGTGIDALDRLTRATAILAYRVGAAEPRRDQRAPLPESAYDWRSRKRPGDPGAPRLPPSAPKSPPLFFLDRFGSSEVVRAYWS